MCQPPRLHQRWYDDGQQEHDHADANDKLDLGKGGSARSAAIMGGCREAAWLRHLLVRKFHG
jgi:hypothetical protein